jgi:hypothetical protein
MQSLKRFVRNLLVVLAILMTVVFGVYLWSLSMPALEPLALESDPQPLIGYADAQARFESVLAADQARGDLDPYCLPVLLSHGRKTQRAIVLLHGLTACPYQYIELGELFFEQGYNVYIPRLPRHGLAESMSENALSGLNAEELAAVIDPSVDLAVGLGDQVSVAGFSLGGDLSTLAGQLRPDLRLAAPLSPALGLGLVPDFLTPTAARLLLGLPDLYLWWDPLNRAKFSGPHGYPGYSSHALGQVLRLALATRALARNGPPAARDLLMVTNWGDTAVSLSAVDELTDDWRGHGAQVQSFRFAPLPWQPHDFISIDSAGVKTDVAYPKLIELIGAYR